MHTLEDSCQFFGIAFSDRPHRTLVLRFRILYEIEVVLAPLGIESIAGTDILKFDSSTDVARA